MVGLGTENITLFCDQTEIESFTLTLCIVAFVDYVTSNKMLNCSSCDVLHAYLCHTESCNSPVTKPPPKRSPHFCLLYINDVMHNAYLNSSMTFYINFRTVAIRLFWIIEVKGSRILFHKTPTYLVRERTHSC